MPEVIIAIALFCSNYPKESNFQLGQASDCQKKVLNCVHNSKSNYDRLLMMCIKQYLEKN